MDRSILISEQLVPEIISERKRVTRRLNRLDYVNREPDNFRLEWLKEDPVVGWLACFASKASGFKTNVKSPFGGPGSKLWVRENWFADKAMDGAKPNELPRLTRVGWLADGPKPDWGGRSRSSIHLPRDIARIELEVSLLELDRLHNISEKSAELEGVPRGNFRDGPRTASNQFHLELNTNGTYVAGFKWTWCVLNGRDSWELNPWVWVVSFNLLNVKQ